MQSPDQLRAEVHRLIGEAKRSRDPTLGQTLAARALELAQEAEAIASLPSDPGGLRAKIARYRHMLDRAASEPKQHVVARLLRDAEDKLQQISQQRIPRLRRVTAA